MSTITASAKAATINLFNAATVAASSSANAIHMIGDLIDVGRTHTREMSFAAQVQEAARRPQILETARQEACIDLVRRQYAVQQELNADPNLKALYDSMYSKVTEATKRFET